MPRPRWEIHTGRAQTGWRAQAGGYTLLNQDALHDGTLALCEAHGVRIGFGRILFSEMKVVNLSVNLV